MAYQDDRGRDPRNYGSEYRRPSVGGLVPGNTGAGPFGGYGPPGFAPSSHAEFYGGEYMIGGYPRPYSGTFPPIGDMMGAGGMIVSGFDAGGTLPVTGRRPRRHPGQARGPYAGHGPRNYRRSDERVKEDVSERMAWDSELDASDIEVEVENCEVTLTGTVDNRFAKRLAEDIAESCAGVSDVRNRLRIRRDD